MVSPMTSKNDTPAKDADWKVMSPKAERAKERLQQADKAYRDELDLLISTSGEFRAIRRLAKLGRAAGDAEISLLMILAESVTIDAFRYLAGCVKDHPGAAGRAR
jgi:hypothetical protein